MPTKVPTTKVPTKAPSVRSTPVPTPTPPTPTPTATVTEFHDYHEANCVEEQQQDVINNNNFDELELEFVYQLDIKRGYSSSDAMLQDVENAIVDVIVYSSDNNNALSGCMNTAYTNNRINMNTRDDDLVTTMGQVVSLSAAPEDEVITTNYYNDDDNNGGNNNSPSSCTPYSEETVCQTVSGRMTLLLESNSSKDAAQNETLEFIRKNMTGRQIVSALYDTYQDNLVRIRYISPDITTPITTPTSAPTPPYLAKNRNDSTSSSSSTNNNLLLAGAAAGGVLLIGLLAFLGVLYKRKQTSTNDKKNKEIELDYPMDDYSDDSETYLSATPSPRNGQRRSSYQHQQQQYYDDDTSDGIMVHRGTSSLAAPFDLPSWFQHTALDGASDNDHASEQQSVVSSAWDMESIHNNPISETPKFSSADFADGDESVFYDPEQPLHQGRYHDSSSLQIV